MSAFSTSIQYSIRNPRHSNQTRRRNRRHPNIKGENKTVMFADDMIVYIENTVDYAKKPLDLISELGKTGKYKVNTQKSKVFFYTNIEISETEII